MNSASGSYSVSGHRGIEMQFDIWSFMIGTVIGCFVTMLSGAIATIGANRSTSYLIGKPEEWHYSKYNPADKCSSEYDPSEVDDDEDFEPPTQSDPIF